MKKGYHHLTAADEAKICRLHAEGKSEKEIARALHIHRNSVYRVQKRMGLSLPRHGPRSPVLTAAQKRRVLGLLRRGMGTGRIAIKLGLREHAVRGVVKESHFRQAPGRRGCRYQVPAETLAKLTAEIQARTNFGVDLS